MRADRDPVVLSYGLGADSTAVLLRWLDEPASRGFDLADLTVITAMTGNEFSDTVELVEAEVLPRMASAGVRYIQVARGGPRAEDGVVVLADSRRPVRLHADGAYTLADELRSGGTLPQVASGRRSCSIKSKGVPIDATIADVIGGSFTHVLGFNADEERRALRDAGFSTGGRRTAYPLIEWEWGRDRVLEEIEAIVQVGRPWPKSCCTFCPFATDHHLDRYAAEPQAGVQAMLLEHVALALNPRMTLFASKSVQSLVEDALPEVAAQFYDRVAGEAHAVYDVRRVFHARRDDPTKKGSANRSVRKVFTGSAVACSTALRRLAGDIGAEPPVVEQNVLRSWVRRADQDRFPTVERFLVVAPAHAQDKQLPSFERWWDAYVSDGMLAA